MRAPGLELFDGKFVGMDKLVAQAKATGKFDYDAPVEGLQVVDRYTLKLKLNYPWWDILADLTSATSAAVAREVVEAYGDAIRLGDGQSGRDRPLSPQGVGARAEDRPRGQSVVPRHSLCCEQRSRRPRRQRAPARQGAAADRPRRGLRAGGEPAARARVREGRHRLPRHSDRSRAQRDGARRPAAAAVRAGRRADGARRAAVDRLRVLQHGGPGRRRLRQREDRAAPRDRDGLQRGGGDPRHPPGAGPVREHGGAARRVRPRPEARRQHEVRPGRRARAARQVRLRRPRQGRLARAA